MWQKWTDRNKCQHLVCTLFLHSHTQTKPLSHFHTFLPLFCNPICSESGDWVTSATIQTLECYFPLWAHKQPRKVLETLWQLGHLQETCSKWFKCLLNDKANTLLEIVAIWSPTTPRVSQHVFFISYTCISFRIKMNFNKWLTSLRVLLNLRIFLYESMSNVKKTKK